MPVVTFLGEFRKAAGRSAVQVEAETVGQLLASMESALAVTSARLLSGEGVLRPDVEVLVNGRNIQFLAMLETSLQPADHVTIFSSGVRGFPGG